MPALSGRLLLRPWFVANGLWMTHFPSRRRRTLWPEMKNNPVSFRRRRRDFFSFCLRHIQHLNTSRRNLHFMIVVELVPYIERQFTRNRLGDEIFDVGQSAFRVRRLEHKALQNLRRNPFAVVMVRAMNGFVLELMGGHDMDGKPIAGPTFLSSAKAEAAVKRTRPSAPIAPSLLNITTSFQRDYGWILGREAAPLE